MRATEAMKAAEARRRVNLRQAHADIENIADHRGMGNSEGWMRMALRELMIGSHSNRSPFRDG